MCLEFGSCFGGRRDDYGGERPSRREEHGGGGRVSVRDRRGNHGSAYNSGANGHKPAYHHQPPVGIDEVGHKAYHEDAQKDDHAGTGDRGGLAPYMQHKADIEIPKVPGLHNKVRDEAYSARLHEAAHANHRNNVAMDYYHYTTSTTTTTLGRY